MFVVIGTTTADIIVRSHTSLIGQGGDGFRAGNLVFCDDPLLMLLGGNGGNSAYALARLGAPVALVSAVGRDMLGDWLAELLRAEGVDLSGLQRDARWATSSSTIIMADAGHQAVFHHKGATDALAITAVATRLFSRAHVLLAASYPLFPAMRAGGFAQALAATHVAGGLTALDIGPAIGAPVTLNELRPLFGHLDYLMANDHELAVCTGEAAWETAVAALLHAGCRCVIAKRGVDGAVLCRPGEQIEVPAFPVTAHISVGAGDAFDAGFLYAAWQGWSPEASLRYGSAVAALMVSSERGVLGAPTRDAVAQFLDAR